MSDPRVYFAAERTLLAWVRSGLTVMALGFVVARFGLVVSLLSHASPSSADLDDSHQVAAALGITLMLLGAIAVLGAAYNHRVFVRSLSPTDVPALGLPWLTSFLALSVGIGGILLAAYLAVA